MQTVYLSQQANLKDALLNIKNFLHKAIINESLSIMQPISLLADKDYYTCKTSLLRFFYQNKDNSFRCLGIGEAHSINKNSYAEALDSLIFYKDFLSNHQIYFGGMRFDENSNVSLEWKDFLTARFVLPLVMLAKINNTYFLQINYAFFGNYNKPTWLDTVYSILDLFSPINSNDNFSIIHEYPTNKNYYNLIVQKALKSFNEKNQKIVLGRKTSFTVNDKINSLWFIQKLMSLNENLYIFLFDLGNNHYFLGHSPELLFSKEQNHITSEALAGTITCLAKDEKEILQLFSHKEHCEHKYVKNWIKDVLTNLNAQVIQSSIEVKKSFNVYHLQQKFAAYVANINEKDLLLKLHPTPAVCGFTKEYAQLFIAENENFDRGYYTGAMGVVSKQYSEFCVAIRCGLVIDNILHLYAACGIVQDSCIESEWQELNAKQQALLRLFD